MRTPRHLDLPGIDIKSTLFDRLKELKGPATNKLKSLGNNRMGKGVFRDKGIFKGSCVHTRESDIHSVSIAYVLKIKKA